MFCRVQDMESVLKMDLHATNSFGVTPLHIAGMRVNNLDNGLYSLAHFIFVRLFVL